MALRMKRHLMSSVPELRIEPTPRRIRALVGTRPVVDTTDAMLVWEPRRLVPVFAVPTEDLHAELVPAAPDPRQRDLADLPPFLGPEDYGVHTTEGDAFSLVVDGQELSGAAFRPSDPDLEGRVTLSFTAFTTWLEEEQELVGHPHDPFKRIDVLPSSRQVTVALDGVVLADTTHPTALLETHLPTRWYLPRDDVRMDLLIPSEHRSTCAYKGHSSYFSLATGGDEGRDIAWTYPRPLLDASGVRDQVCFWSERTDLTVDGSPVRRPVTPWSTPEEQRTTGPDLLEFG